MLLRLATSSRHAVRRNALKLTKDAVSNMLEAGISPHQFSQLLRPLKHASVNSKCTDDNKGFNQRILDILSNARKGFNIDRVHQSSQRIRSMLSTLMTFDIPEPMARDIIQNNPLLLALPAEDIEEICRELKLSGVEVCDFSSILSQHAFKSISM